MVKTINKPNTKKSTNSNIDNHRTYYAERRVAGTMFRNSGHGSKPIINNPFLHLFISKLHNQVLSQDSSWSGKAYATCLPAGGHLPQSHGCKDE